MFRKGNEQNSVHGCKDDVKQHATQQPVNMMPCMGLDETHDVCIRTYIIRTGAHSGGALSCYKTAHSLYKKDFHDLTNEEKENVKC